MKILVTLGRKGERFSMLQLVRIDNKLVSISFDRDVAKNAHEILLKLWGAGSHSDVLDSLEELNHIREKQAQDKGFVSSVFKGIANSLFSVPLAEDKGIYLQCLCDVNAHIILKQEFFDNEKNKVAYKCSSIDEMIKYVQECTQNSDNKEVNSASNGNKLI